MQLGCDIVRHSPCRVPEPMSVDISGLQVDDLPDDCIPLEAIVLIKCLAPDGATMICERSSDGITPWEAIGMALSYADGLRHALVHGEEEDDAD